MKPGTNYVGRAFANDFKIEDPSVSGSHAQIVVNDGGVTVKDLGSTNGTFINRLPVAEGKLQPGQWLRLGGVEMILEEDSAAVPAAEGVFAMAAAAVPAMSAIGTVTSSAPPMAVPAIPAPTAGRMRIGSPAPPTVALAPPPMIEPPAGDSPPIPPSVPGTAGMVEPPPGMTMCKYHPKNAGQWLCQSCTLLFCSLCVTTRRTDAGTGYFCRKCGAQCAPVRVKYVASREKGPKAYSDVVILLRAVGFGFGAAVLAGVLWTGFAALTQFDVMPVFAAVTGVLCGYGVKLGVQDRPGIIFSLMAVGFCLLGVIIGKVGMIIVTHNTILGISNMAYGLFGLLVGFFFAWKLGGGDF